MSQGNVPYFGRTFLGLNYIDGTKNTCIQSLMVMGIMVREVLELELLYIHRLPKTY
jgi:hypothetical protein